MRVSQCCVPGCNYVVGTVRHRFPVFEETVFKIWVERIAYPNFGHMDDLKIYNNYFVCDKHFGDECRSPGTKKLNIGSLPSLNLPTPDHIVNCLSNKEQSCPSTNKEGCPSTSLEPCPNTSAEQCPSTSVEPCPDTSVKPCPDTSAEPCPSTSTQQCHDSTSLEVGTCSPVVDERGITLGSFSHSGCKKDGLLKSLEVSRAKFLTPKARKLYNYAKTIQKDVAVLSRCCLSFKSRFKAAEKLASKKGFVQYLSSLPPTSRLFINCQIRNQSRHRKGYRFTVDEKILSLAILKQAGNRAYRLLAKLFMLPTKRSISKMLERVPFNPGISTNIFEHLKARVQKMNPLDRTCTLVFDEMAISPGLTFKPNEDVVEGFQDLGDGNRSPEFADHALVLMLRGVRQNWKQPISYMFVKGTVKTNDLVRTLKAIIRAVFNTGLKVIATVCDQGSTNVSAINVLLKETHENYLRRGEENRRNGFEIDGINIVPIYDPPHLLKGVRNNLLKSNLSFKEGGKEKIANWKHVIDFYLLDTAEPDDNRRMCPKLTAEHVLPDHIRKMKVKCCSQVFSHRVSSIMRKLAQWSRFIIVDAPVKSCKNLQEQAGLGVPPESGVSCDEPSASNSGRCYLDPAAEDTADLLLFMDELFDSVNGTSRLSRNGKTLRCAVSTRSRHRDFWGKALKVLHSMEFHCNKTGRKSVPPSLKHWIDSIRGFIFICDNLLDNGFKYVSLRHFNQDPLENFFGCIRSHGARNINPTTESFKSSFKALLLSNFVSSHSAGANCEYDYSEGALDTLKGFVFQDQPKNSEPSCHLHSMCGGHHEHPTMSNSVPCVDDRKLSSPRKKITVAVTSYISGYIARKVFITTKDCNTCKQQLLANVVQPVHDFIIARRYTPKALCLPHTRFVSICGDIINVIQQNLPSVCHRRNVAKCLSLIVHDNVKFDCLNCDKHNLKVLTVRLLTNLIVHTWVKNVNRILCGKVSCIGSQDPIKAKAMLFFQKHKKPSK